MAKLRVLVVDGNADVRRAVTEALDDDPGLNVVAALAGGRAALARLRNLEPDVVVLDTETADMDGLQTLGAIRGLLPRLPVILFSVQARRGATVTLDALLLGANDYLTKPADLTRTSPLLRRTCDELAAKIKALCVRPESQSAMPTPLSHSPRSLQAPARVGVRIDVVAIAISTGGPNALAALVPQFEAAFPVPVLIVQHMPAEFTPLLADRLAATSALRVKEAATGDVVTKGSVYLAAGGAHLALERVSGQVLVRTHGGPRENGCRPSADVMLRSVAEAYGGHVLAVIMTGLGNDGLQGCRAIHDQGGVVFVQDQASSVVWGMPGAVANAGLAHRILPLDGLALEIGRAVTANRPSLGPLAPAVRTGRS